MQILVLKQLCEIVDNYKSLSQLQQLQKILRDKRNVRYNLASKNLLRKIDLPLTIL